MNSMTSSVKTYQSKFEEYLGPVAKAIKPRAPVLARVLMVSTFLEDSMRMWLQWNTQVRFLERNGLTGGLAEAFLYVNILLQVGGSGFAIAGVHTIPAVISLTVVLLMQMVAYRLYFDFRFLCVVCSLLGGFLILITESIKTGSKKENLEAFQGVIDAQRDFTKYLMLMGRVMLVFLYFSFAFDFKDEMGSLRLVLAVLGLGLCVFVVVGFKAKESAAVLLVFLFILNVVTKSWWNLTSKARSDFIKYEFFQVLSVGGGYLLLTIMGPGNISLDKKKDM